MSSSDHDRGAELTDRFDAARERPPTFEAERMLADLGRRLFGLAAEPQRLGRFTVLGRLGAGGMGVVYLAHDAELDRKVAVKLLRVHGPDAAAPLRREARALARVDHPHVVAVHEVGTHEGAVFLAMDRVEGVTLAEWQRDRPWREVVEVYLQAGRGLAAAHAAGVIHRDFKPANVLVGVDEHGAPRARVVDFGLARGPDEERDETPGVTASGEPDPSALARGPGEAPGPGPDVRSPGEPDPAGERARALASTRERTATGALLGTPAYMAPEQLEGRRADARSDQFSFALALHEGVCGQRAFAGDDLDELRAAVLLGRRRRLEGPRRGPRWLYRVIDRALATAPGRRWPSMQALLERIDRGLRRRRRVAAGVAALALGVAGALAGSRVAAPPRCAGGADALAEVWHEGARTAARAAFLATGKPFAAHAWAQAEARVDQHAAAWLAMHREACEATHVRGEQSSEALDRRMRCLERRRLELGALLAVFAEADARTVAHALEASDALTPIDACADLDALAGALVTPEDARLREPVARVRADLDRARALRLAGHYDEAFALAGAVHAEAVRLGHAPVRAETGLLLGSLHGLRGAADEAAAALDRAFLDALACGHAEVAAWSALSAAHVVGSVAHRGAEGRRWGELAEALLERIDREPRAAASLYANLGNIAVVEGALDEARARFEAALAIAESSLGPDHIVVANTLANLAAVQRRAGELEQARALYRRTREIFVARLGASHPALATLTNNTGALLQTMGDLEGAARSYREVLALAGASLSPTSPTLGHAHNNLAEVLLAQGDPAGALPHARAAAEIWSASLGERHPLVGQAQLAAGRLHVELADPAAALAALQPALEILQTAGADADTVAAAQFELARALVLAAPDDPSEAIAAAQAAAAAMRPGEPRDRVVAWLRERAGL